MCKEVRTTKSSVAPQLNAIPIPIKQQSLPSRIISLKMVPCNRAVKQAPMCTGIKSPLALGSSTFGKDEYYVHGLPLSVATVVTTM